MYVNRTNITIPSGPGVVVGRVDGVKVEVGVGVEVGVVVSSETLRNKC